MTAFKSGSHGNKLLNVCGDFKISYFEKNWTVKYFEGDDWINKLFFPDDITLALLSRASYKDEPQELPHGWKLIITAKNEEDGYFGAAFLNINDRQLVIAHRGTKLSNLAAVLTDIEGIIYNQFTSQMDSASSFVAFVLKQFDLGKMSVSFTGHSLGAWLAQITTFTAKYLIMTDSGFNRNNDPIDCQFHPHTVVFDSPGCYEMLTKLSENYYHRYENKAHCLINSLDIHCYLSAPNLINTCNRHLGSLYRVYPPLPDWGLKWAAFVETLTKNPHEAINYTLSNHGIKNIILALKERSKIQKILDWPLLTWSCGSKSKVAIPTTLFFKVIKLFKRFAGLTYEKIFNLNNHEYKVFFEFANKCNNYNPEVDVTVNIGDIVLHYKVEENPVQECSTSIFNQDELAVLESWLIIKDKKVHPAVVESFFNQCDLGNPDKFFNVYNFCLKNGSKIISCATKEVLNSVINNIKNIMLYFPQLKEVIKVQMACVPQLADALLHAQAKDYLIFNKIYKNEMLFIDTIGIQQFLKSNDSILYVKTNYKNLEPRLIYSILSELYGQIEFSEGSNFIILDWSQLLHLDSTLGISCISKQSFDVLVLDCVAYIEEDIDDRRVQIITGLFEDIFSNEISSKKIIMIGDENESWKGILLKIQQPYRECKAAERLWDCLSPDSHAKIIQKENIVFQNSAEKSSLKKIVGLEILNQNDMSCLGHILDDEILLELINNKTLEIGQQALGLFDLSECFSQVYLPISNSNLINYLLTNMPNCEIATIIISGIGQSDDDILKNKLMVLLEVDTMENNVHENIKELIGTINEKDKRLLIASNNFRSLNFKTFCFTLPSRMIYWIQFLNNQFILKEIYNTNFFMDREFIFHSKLVITHHLRDELIKDDINDTYIFINGNLEDLLRTFYISEINEKEVFLKKHKQGNIRCFESETDARLVFEQIKKENHVHMISFENGELIWIKSDGSLNPLIKYFDTEKSREVSMWTNEFIENIKKNKTVLLVGDPGMGKTTILLKVSEILRETHWVIFINLKYCKLAIERLPLRQDDISSAQVLDFLIEACNIGSLEQNIIKFKIEFMNEGKQLILLFDGFDEIKDKIGKTKVLNLLKFLREKTSIWVNTRYHDVEELQNSLCVLGIKLREFNLVEQKEYLMRFWKSRLRLSFDIDIFAKCFEIKGCIQKNKFEIFADTLLQNVKDNFVKKSSNILEIPLQIRFLAEVFENMFSEFMMSNSCDLDFGSISFLILFKKFVNLKMSIYLREKLLLFLGNSALEEWFKEPIMKRHLRLAFFELFPDYSEKFICGKPPFLVDHDSGNLILNDEEAEELLRVGFIRSFKNDFIEFIYQVVTEYFCAEYLFKLLNSRLGNNKSLPALEFLVGNVLLKPEFKSMHLFLNECLTCDRFTKEVLAFYGDHLTSLWTSKPHHFTNECYQNVFHIISRSNYLNILKFLESCLIASSNLDNCIDFIFSRNLLGETALFEAAKFSFGNIIDEYCLILKKVCKASIKKALLATIFKEEHYKGYSVIKTLINHIKAHPGLCEVFREIEDQFPNLESIFKSIKNADISNVESTLSQIAPETCKYLLLAVDSCGNTFLHLAAYYSKWDVFQLLLKFYSNSDLGYIMLLKNEAEQSVMKVIVGKSKTINMNVVGLVVLEALLKLPLKERYPLLITRNSEDMTILHLAAEDEQWEVVLKLINCLEKCYQPEAINARDVRGKSVFHFAAQKGGLHIVKELVDRGADILDSSGCSVLHEAVCNPDKTVLLYFLKECNEKFVGDGQKIYSFLNAMDRKGDTPLMWAAERGDIDGVKLLLLEPRIDIQIKNSEGKTALNWAIEKHHNEIVEALQSHKENTN